MSEEKRDRRRASEMTEYMHSLRAFHQASQAAADVGILNDLSAEAPPGAIDEMRKTVGRLLAAVEMRLNERPGKPAKAPAERRTLALVAMPDVRDAVGFTLTKDSIQVLHKVMSEDLAAGKPVTVYRGFKQVPVKGLELKGDGSLWAEIDLGAA